MFYGIFFRIQTKDRYAKGQKTASDARKKTLPFPLVLWT